MLDSLRTGDTSLELRQQLIAPVSDLMCAFGTGGPGGVHSKGDTPPIQMPVWMNQARSNGRNTRPYKQRMPR